MPTVKEIVLSPEYSPEQQAAIAAAVADTKTHSNFVEYTWSDRIVQRGVQTFAVFGTTARELLDFDYAENEKRGIRFEYAPMIVDGRMLEQWPDEGRTGIAYLQRMTKNHGEPCEDAWRVTFMHTGWLRTSELELSNEQIEDIIADEADQGLDPLGLKPPGWV